MQNCSLRVGLVILCILRFDPLVLEPALYNHYLAYSTMASSSAADPSAGARRTRKVSEAFSSEADNAPTTLPDTTRLVESSRTLGPRKSQTVDHPSEGGLGSDDERVSLSDEEDEEEEVEVDSTGTKTEPQQRKEPTFESPTKPVRVAGSSVKTELETLVKAVDPNNGRCILTGMAEPASAIRLAHIMPHSTKASVLTVLEYHWNIPHRTLKMDTRFNVVSIMAEKHIYMDAGHWALVPHYAGIDKIEKWVERRKGNAKDRSSIADLWKRDSNTTELEKHIYFMLPLSDALQNMPIYRLPPNPESDPKVPEERHVFPFKSLGPLISHIQPHFVVFALGARLATLEEKMGPRFEKWLDDLAENAPSFGYTRPTVNQIADCLQKIRKIYKTWTSDNNLPSDGHGWYKKK
ncbi:hypothetical protein GGX14DRAFT_627094 [Mycena pura]|uniref:HNH nuclease domain-containing protein n=1 Tax=Mycena pura TaxID=153505 RepID=A0AAD6YQY1_9AGAR|nr:hypothetical protein GGX14DRAFT_627094 [Mycena pura]